MKISGEYSWEQDGGSKKWGATPRSEGESERGGGDSRTRGRDSRMAGFGAGHSPQEDKTTLITTNQMLTCARD